MRSILRTEKLRRQAVQDTAQVSAEEPEPRRAAGTMQEELPESIPAAAPVEPAGTGTTARPAADPGTHEETPAVSPVPKTGSTPQSAWKVGLVVTASAFCGGIAVVLWNRRILAKLRESIPPAGNQRSFWEDD